MSTTSPPAERTESAPPTPRRFWWVNQATLKGAVLVLFGAVVLASPDEEHTAEFALGALLVAWAAIEFWYHVVRTARGRPARRLSVVESVVVLSAGALLILPVGVAVTVVAGIYLAVRGVFALVRAWRTVDDRRDRLIVALSLIAVGLLVVLVPETVMLALRAVIGAGGIGLGIILIAAGFSRQAEEGTLSPREINAASIVRVGGEWLRQQRLTPGRKDVLAETLFFEPPDRPAKLTSFWVMMLLSVGIASFAVIQDSTAVVIGAMLVAPLMGPIMGVAAGIVNGWPRRLIASLLLVAAAVAAAVALAWLIAGWLPSVGDLGTNSQVQSRIAPSLIDLCIAITAGAAGAYATVDSRTSSSLPGVAIAVALVPPLAVVGITMQSGEWGDALGAFLLFFTNFVSIVLSGSLVFFLTGFAVLPLAADRKGPVRRVFQTVLLGGLLILIPLSLTSQSIWSDASNEGVARDAVTAWIPDGADLAIEELDVRGTTVELTLTGSTEPPDVEPLESQLEEAFGEPVTLKARYVPSVALTPGENPSLPSPSGT